jgi:hypothetical protein
MSNDSDLIDQSPHVVNEQAAANFHLVTSLNGASGLQSLYLFDLSWAQSDIEMGVGIVSEEFRVTQSDYFALANRGQAPLFATDC